MKGITIRVALSAAMLASTLAVAGCASQPVPPAPPLLDEDQLGNACTGDFDRPPALVAGEFPVYPASMMYRSVIEDRKTRHLPMKWEVRTEFSIDEAGAVREVRSSNTDPQMFSSHTTLAVREWRFRPATRQSQPVAVHCRVTVPFDLTNFPGTL